MISFPTRGAIITQYEMTTSVQFNELENILRPKNLNFKEKPCPSFSNLLRDCAL